MSLITLFVAGVLIPACLNQLKIRPVVKGSHAMLLTSSMHYYVTGRIHPKFSIIIFTSLNRYNLILLQSQK